MLRFFIWMLLLWPTLVWAQRPTLTVSQNMNFGNVTASPTGGTVVMNPAGGLTPAGVTLAGGIVTPMQFQLQGVAGDAYVWQNVPVSAALGGGITVDTWTSSPPGYPLGGIFTGAPTTMFAGATLHIPPAAVPGVYTATITRVRLRDNTNGRTSRPRVSFTMTVTILQPMTLTVLRNLNFGLAAVQGAVGNCVVAPTSARSATGGVKLVTGVPVAQSAQVRADGPAGFAFSLTFTPGTMTGPGTNITVDTFTHDSTLLLDGAGQNTFNVGATAHLNFPQVVGTYTGSFTITASIP